MAIEFDEAFDITVSTSGTRDTAIADVQTFFGSSLLMARGSSKRNPIDKHDEELAILLATSRALLKLSKQFKKEANIRENDLARIAKLKSGKVKVIGGTLHPAIIASKAPTKRSTGIKKASGKRTSAKVKISV